MRKPIFFFNLFLVSLTIALAAWRFLAPHYTYIKEINIGEYSAITKHILKSVNKETNNILFRKSLRPIYIRWGDLNPYIMGQTTETSYECIIELNNTIKGNSFFQFSTTLLHELGHCYGLKDNYLDNTDVMYYADSPLVTEESIKRHIKLLKEIGK